MVTHITKLSIIEEKHNSNWFVYIDIAITDDRLILKFKIHWLTKPAEPLYRCGSE